MIYTLKFIRLLCILLYLIFLPFLSNLYAENDDGLIKELDATIIEIISTLFNSETNTSQVFNKKNQEEIIPTSFKSDISSKDWNSFRHIYEDIFPLSQTKNTTRYLEKTGKFYWDLKENNFNDYTVKDRIILLYLHSILDRILESNTDIFSTYGKSDIEKFLNLNWKIAKNEFYIAKTEKKDDISHIVFNIDDPLPHFINDAYIAATLCHEIAHILLNHIQRQQDLADRLKKEYIHQHPDYENFMDNTGYTQKDFFSFIKDLEKQSQIDKYLEIHPDYINLKRQLEIEADNLGFILYLNAGFKASYYRNSYLLLELDKNPYAKLPLSPKIKKQLLSDFNAYRSSLSNPYKNLSLTDYLLLPHVVLENFLTGLDSKDKDYILELMNNIKYENLYAVYPTNFWRFWSLLNLENIEKSKNNQQVLNNKTLNVVYLKIDLSNIKGLNKIRKLLSKKDLFFKKLDHNDTTDPRVYIIQELFSEDSRLSFSFEIYPEDRKDIGIVRKDNTILLRANDVFQSAYLFIKKEIIESSYPCSVLFGTERLESEFKESEYLNTNIKYSFKNNI